MKALSLSKASTHLEAKDFLECFQENPNAYVSTKIRDYAFTFEALSEEERDAALLEVMDCLLHRPLIRAGEDRISQWEKGWAENLDAFQSKDDLPKVLPRYFEKIDRVRWKQQWIRPTSPQFEYRMLAIIQDWLFDKYLRSMDGIYEFGCGTGHNLFRARSVNPKAKLWGLDWATSSQKLFGRYREFGVDENIYGHRFDYFSPDMKFNIAENSAVVTVASLEQTGDRFKTFIDYLIEKRPALCIHIEPIAELLDPSQLLDYLSIEYFKKRNYLCGFLDHLRLLESQGKLEIMRAQRTFIGSFFIDGYSVVVWKPL